LKKMKLRYGFSPRLGLFAFSFGLALLCLPCAQVRAQDKLITTKGQAQNVKILNVSGNNIHIQVGNGSVGVPLATVTAVVMAAPPEATEASGAFAAKDYAKALQLAQTINAKYLGLPVEWARECASLAGDAQVELGRLQEAEAAYTAFQRAYPQSGSIQVDVGMARIALSRKNFDEASARLAPIAQKARENPFETGPNAKVYSQTFLLLGEIAEARKQPVPALENYLRTVTVFYRDENAAAQAREKADALRKTNPALALP
jgi:hypothetical protein